MIGTTDDPQANRKHADDFSIKQDNTNTEVFVPAATRLINIVTDTPALATNPTSKSLLGRESYTRGTKLATAETIKMILGRGISLTFDFYFNLPQRSHTMHSGSTPQARLHQAQDHEL